MRAARRLLAERSLAVLVAAVLLVGGAGMATARTLFTPHDDGVVCPSPDDVDATEPEDGGEGCGSAEDEAEDPVDLGGVESLAHDAGTADYEAADCEEALQLDLQERRDLAAALDGGENTGLAHAVETVLANCEDHPNHGLVNALWHLADNWQRHAEHEAWQAERAEAREAAKAEREAARAEREAARAEGAADGHPGNGNGHGYGHGHST